MEKLQSPYTLPSSSVWSAIKSIISFTHARCQLLLRVANLFCGVLLLQLIKASFHLRHRCEEVEAKMTISNKPALQLDVKVSISHVTPTTSRLKYSASFLLGICHTNPPSKHPPQSEAPPFSSLTAYFGGCSESQVWVWATNPKTGQPGPPLRTENEKKEEKKILEERKICQA